VAKAVVNAAEEPVEVRGAATRGRGKLYVLAAASIAAVYLSYRLVYPFIPAIVWATTAAVITHRFSQWVGRHVKKPDLKAVICTGTVAVAILLPIIGAGYVGIQQVARAFQELKTLDVDKKMDHWLKGHPKLQQAWTSLSKELDPEKATQWIDRLQPRAVAVLSTQIYVAIQLLLTLFILYFLYRDEQAALDGVRSVMPLSDRETGRLLRRVDDTIHATIYGVLVVSIIQGIMGGTMFALMGIPGAVLWGAVMGLLAMIPYLGAFVVWGPVAAFLAFNGEWGKALILTTYGAMAIGLIDNLLYPYLVGHRLRQHTVMAFFAILGGVNLFGATGLVLGPVILSVTFFLFELWRQRTEHGASAERP